MTYQLPPNLDQRIQAHLALGGYQTPDEVLTDALDALEQCNADLVSIQAGIEDEQAGRVKPLSEIDRDMRQHFGMPSQG
jgi:predicted transcriptional regulator